MRRYDFFLTYEVKTREIEYLTLLKCELEKRGYKVGLAAANQITLEDRKYKTRVVFGVGFSLVGSNFGPSIVFDKAIELPAEQIRINEDKESVLERDEIQRSVAVVAWGKNYKNKLINEGKMAANKIFVLGHPAMDFCKERFSGYYLSKGEVSFKYGLPTSKRWMLFISSFTSETVGLSESRKWDEIYGVNHYVPMYENEMATRQIVFEWFEEYVKNHSDCIIIYRPHPVEEISLPLRKLSEKYKNFRIIRDDSVRQWISVSDSIYTWYSTSCAEAFFMKKPFFVVRPVPIEWRLELEIFKRTDCFISNYYQFEKSMMEKKGNMDSPLDDSIYDYYEFDDKLYTYEKLADLCEEVYKNDEYLIPKACLKQLYHNNIKRLSNLGTKTKIKLFFRNTVLYAIYHDLFSRNVAYMKLRPGELRKLEKRMIKCIETQ